MAMKPKPPTAEIDMGAFEAKVPLSLKKKKKKKPAGKKDEKAIKPIPASNAKKWLDKVKRSEKCRKPFLDESEKYWRMYQGDYNKRPDVKRKDFDTISVNYVYSHVETITPSVFSGFPFIKVRPKPKVGELPADGEKRAESMTHVINYWFKELALDEELKDVFLDTFFGPATVELGWETQVDERPAEADTQDGQGEVEEPEVVLKKDRPFIVRREFKTLLLDPDARRRRDCRWIGVEEIVSWNDFIANPKYTDKAKKFLKPQYYPVEENEKNWMGRDEDQSDKEWLKLVTIWDKDTQQIYVVSEGYQGFVNSEDEQGEPWPYEMEYKSDPFPFCIHDAKTDRKSPYTWSEIKAGEPQIVEQNRIRSAMQVHVKRSLPKYAYSSAAGSRAQINKLMQARSDEAVELANPDAFKSIEVAEIPKPLFEFNSMARDDLTGVLGTSEYNNQSLADTATEAQIVEGRSQARKSLRSRQWEQFVVEIAGKLAQLCQQNMDEALAIEIAGKEGIEWLTVTREQIQGEFYYDIEPGIMEYKNEALRRSQLLKMLELTAGDASVKRNVLIAKVAKEMDLDPSEFIIADEDMPKPPPPEPNIKFKDIDPATLQNPAFQNALVVAALSQNGVQLDPAQAAAAQGLPPPIAPPPVPGGPPQGGDLPQGGGPSPSGKDISSNGMNPNGNEALPPVAGNLNEGL